MWLIGICAMAGLALVLWKLTELSRIASRNTRLIASVDEQLAAGRIAEALTLARQADAPAGRMLTAGLARRGAPVDRVMTTSHNVARIELARAARGVEALATLATATTLLGFLACVLALLSALDAAREQTLLDPTRTTEAVVAALLIAAAGIVVGIPLRVMSAYFASRVRRLGLELSGAAARMVDALAAVDGASDLTP